MRVMRFADSGHIPALDEVEMPKPQPRSGELRVRVHAAGITPTEVLWYPTTHTKGGGSRTHAIPAHEFSGVVDATGQRLGRGKLVVSIVGDSKAASG